MNDVGRGFVVVASFTRGRGYWVVLAVYAHIPRQGEGRLAR
jgi:hypothetical protein